MKQSCPDESLTKQKLPGRRVHAESGPKLLICSLALCSLSIDLSYYQVFCFLLALRCKFVVVCLCHIKIHGLADCAALYARSIDLPPVARRENTTSRQRGGGQTCGTFTTFSLAWPGRITTSIYIHWNVRFKSFFSSDLLKMLGTGKRKQEMQLI